MDRREFFRSLARETVASFHEVGGRPQLQLADLPRLPDAALAGIAPRVLPQIEIVVAEGRVAARRPGEDAPAVLFDDDAASVFVFNRFNGRTTIARIAEELAAAMSWDAPRAFDCTKNLFLRLVRLGVSVPANDPSGAGP